MLPGRPHPLGATWDGSGTNFAIYSEHADWVELCLFDQPNAPEAARMRLPERTTYVWHGYIHGLQPGQIYGYRVHGPFQPNDGLRFNASKLLIDPYAKALAGQVDWSSPIFPYQPGNGDADLSSDENDDAAGMQKCVVVNPYFDWEEDRPLCLPLSDSIIYELHVKGFTKTASRDSGSAARNLCGAGGQALHSISEAAGRHRGRAYAGACVPD